MRQKELGPHPDLDEQLRRLDEGWSAYRLRSGAVLSDEQAQYVYNYAKFLTVVRETHDKSELESRVGLGWKDLANMEAKLNLTGAQGAGLQKRIELSTSIACGERDIDKLPPGVKLHKPRLSFSILRHRINVW